MIAKFASYKVVVMRPRLQAVPLAKALSVLGVEAEILPMLEIIPTQTEQVDLVGVNIVIVASSNAIDCLPTHLLSSLQGKQILTLGEATAQAVHRRGLAVHYVGESGTTSERLLSTPLLQSKVVNGQKILLLAGWDGRTVLAQELMQRGAKVEWLRVYRQQLPIIDYQAVFARYQQDRRKYCFIATSSKILANFQTVATPCFLPWIYQMPLIVVSERIAEQARRYGFERVCNAGGADERAILGGVEQVLTSSAI